MEVECAHLVGVASIMPRSAHGPRAASGENLWPVVAQDDGFWYSDRAAKNLDLAALWERALVARNVAAVV